MLQKAITFTNPFTDEEVTETHFFHISKADLVEMELEEHGKPPYMKDGTELTGMQAKLQRIVDSEDGKAIIAEFKDIIRRSYGVKDGERFRKTKEAWDDFASSEAFSQLLFELCTNPGAAAEFTNGVVPNNLDQIAEEVRQQAATVAKGREAQELAKAAGAASAEATAPEPVADTSEGDSARKKEIAQATTENPVTLAQSEIAEIDSEDLQTGLASGRYKLS